MATLQRSGLGKVSKTWRARVKFECEEHYLGSYPTKEKAEAVEKAYREDLEKDFGPPQYRGYNSKEMRRERSYNQQFKR